MPAPCFESQTKEKLKIPPAVAKAFMNEVIDHLIGGKSYPDALEELVVKSGLQKETINSLLRKDPKVFSLTKQAVAHASKARLVRNAAEAFATDLKTDGSIYQGPGKIAKAWDSQRRIALAGHSPVFPWTHMRDWAVQVPTQAGRERMAAFWQSATDVWKYRGVKGEALYEMDMSLMQKGDYYDFFKSSGADIVPGKRMPGDILLQDRKPSWQTRNFDALKVARYTNLNAIWDGLDPALKEGDTGKAIGAFIARDMNYATGSIMPPAGESANPLSRTGSELSKMAGEYNLLLSSKLFFAKHMNAWLSPLRYLAKTGQMVPAERAAANVALKRWANTVTTHFAILGINYAFNKAVGWQTPNLTDPTKSDFWRIRLGNIIVPFSPMLEALRLPIVVTAAGFTKGTGGQKLWNAVWNAAHPAFHTVYEQGTGKDFTGRPIPSARGLVQNLVKGRGASFYLDSKKPRVSLGEYLLGKGPIAVSGATHQYYQALRDEGMDAHTAMSFVKGAGQAALAGASSALFGLHSYEEEPKPEKKTKKSGFSIRRQ